MLVNGNARHDLIVSNLILFGGKSDAIIPVAWTLFHEVIFYLMFILLIYNRSFGFIALAAWFFICFLNIGMPEVHYAIYPINLLFGFGIVAFFIVESGKRTVSGVTLGMALFFAVAVEDMYGKTLDPTSLSFCYGIASVLFLLGAISAERQGGFRPLPGLPLLGEASYSLYLIHYPLLSLLAKVFMAISVLRTLPDFIAFGLLTMICIAAAVAFHLWVEKPVLHYLDSKLGPARAAV